MDRIEMSLEELLEHVQNSLRAGDFSDLPRLTAAMEAAEAQAALLDPEELRRIRRLAERNAQLMIASRNGIRAARRRIAEVLSVARGDVAYDKQGRRISRSDDGELARRY